MQILDVLALKFHARTVNTLGASERVVKHPDKVHLRIFEDTHFVEVTGSGFLSLLQLFPHLHPSR